MAAASGHVACALTIFQERAHGCGFRVLGLEFSLLSRGQLRATSVGGGLGPGATQGTSESPPLLFKKGFLGFLTVPRDLRGEWRVIT